MFASSCKHDIRHRHEIPLKHYLKQIWSPRQHHILAQDMFGANRTNIKVTRSKSKIDVRQFWCIDLTVGRYMEDESRLSSC